MSVRTYQDALDYLYSFVDYSLERSYRYSAELFDLGRVRHLLHALGDPHERYPAFTSPARRGRARSRR
jgi:dihydrofolate synthase/folylpolyglutamate synthase